MGIRKQQQLQLLRRWRRIRQEEEVWKEEEQENQEEEAPLLLVFFLFQFRSAILTFGSLKELHSAIVMKLIRMEQCFGLVLLVLLEAFLVLGHPKADPEARAVADAHASPDPVARGHPGSFSSSSSSGGFGKKKFSSSSSSSSSGLGKKFEDHYFFFEVTK
ncbi:unnamed protein product [Darwinula stevensoni]|uniref:Uncharacterized protein n=1 Tax=Darwinula stevensoni TaxID=69355 RepID=A0A7R9ADI6_9CRUS|nr:unnamed protein product [Darwinula stevensoni]CAG0901348.1 unnamed protein product [Darwinula stevensoni]